MLSLINAGLVGTQKAPGGGLLPMVAALALAYGGVAQLIAGLWEFRTGNTFGAVAFCSYGAFWISFFFIVQSVGKNAPTEVFSGLGLYLWMWGIFTAYMFIASLRTTGAVALVFLLLAITFIVLGIGNSALAGTLNATNGTIKLGGYIGIVTAIAAWYASFAGVINATFGRTIRRSSRSAADSRAPTAQRIGGVQLEIQTAAHVAASTGAGSHCRRPLLTRRA